MCITEIKYKFGGNKMQGEYFADYDSVTGLWCVFHTDHKTGFAFSSWVSREQAEKEANKKNEEV